MKKREVEQLIGQVPGNYCTRWGWREGTTSVWGQVNGEGGTGNICWANDHGQIAVWFDDEGNPTGAYFDPYIPPTFLEKLFPFIW